MCGQIEWGNCEICGKECQIERTYFYYPVNCECHNCGHFVLVRHCSDCIPEMPKEIYPYFRALDGKERRATIINILPNEISGSYIINDKIVNE